MQRRKPRPDLAARNAARSDPNALFRLYPSEHAIWRGMIQRCHNPNAKDYPNYGARGISVCDRWRYEFGAFLSDMGPRPAGHSIDRLDNNLGYFKENCAWRTCQDQARNKRSNRLVEYRGERLPVVAWAARFGLSRALLRYRLSSGWSVEDALTRPASKSLNYRHHSTKGTP